MNSNPYSANGSVWKKGDPTAIGCTALQISCTNPGNVSSADRSPPPIADLPSSTSTDSPFCCNTIAAASPLGP